jgi:predicted nucleotidyltransferase
LIIKDILISKEPGFPYFSSMEPHLYKKLKDKEAVVRKLTDFLSQRSEIEFAYIFGSFPASDTFHDIDIAAALVRNNNTEDRNIYPWGYESFMLGQLYGLLKTEKVDFVVINKAGLVLQQRIISKGLLLFDRDIFKRVEYENYIRKSYIDAEHLRKIQLYYMNRKP